MIFFNGNSCGWIAPCSNVESQLRLMVEELEADMLKKASQKTARSKVLAAVAEGKPDDLQYDLHHLTALDSHPVRVYVG